MTGKNIHYAKGGGPLVTRQTMIIGLCELAVKQLSNFGSKLLTTQ